MSQIKQTPAQKKVLMDLDSILKDLDKIESKQVNKTKELDSKKENERETNLKISEVREQIQNILEKRLQDRDIVIERKTKLLTAYKPGNGDDVEQSKTIVV
jgi:carbonic anhydrase